MDNRQRVVLRLRNSVKYQNSTFKAVFCFKSNYRTHQLVGFFAPPMQRCNLRILVQFQIYLERDSVSLRIQLLQTSRTVLVRFENGNKTIFESF